MQKTIYDIAEESGVSIATVSRVIRGGENVSEKTRSKVEQIIDKHHYRPSSIARSMTGQRGQNLGIVLPKLLNPNYAMIFTGASEQARHRGYSLSLFPWKSIVEQSGNPALMLAERRLDGVVILIEYMPPTLRKRIEASLKDLQQYMPVVLIGCVPTGFDYPCISYNPRDIVREEVRYLISLGHRKIAFVGGMEEDQDERRRDMGYQDGLQEARLPYVASYRAFCEGTATAGEEASGNMFHSLLREYWPTAIIALNDMVAMGCMQTGRNMGLRLPQDISIMGCDDLFCAPYLTPSLSTVDMCQQELGKRAVELLLSGEKRQEDASWHLVKRQSCAACAEK